MKKVIKNLDDGAKGTYQKPLLVSSVLKILAPANWASVLSTEGRGCTLRCTFSVSG